MSTAIVLLSIKVRRQSVQLPCCTPIPVTDCAMLRQATVLWYTLVTVLLLPDKEREPGDGLRLWDEDHLSIYRLALNHA